MMMWIFISIITGQEKKEQAAYMEHTELNTHMHTRKHVHTDILCSSSAVQLVTHVSEVAASFNNNSGYLHQTHQMMRGRDGGVWGVWRKETRQEIHHWLW
eukprot:scpid51421/ scgid28840/ 